MEQAIAKPRLVLRLPRVARSVRTLLPNLVVTSAVSARLARDLRHCARSQHFARTHRMFNLRFTAVVVRIEQMLLQKSLD